MSSVLDKSSMHGIAGQPEAKAPQPPMRAASRWRRSWDQAALRTKLAVLTTCAVTGGTATGLAAAWLPAGWIWAVTAVIGFSLLLYEVGRRWVSRPVDHLLHQARQISLMERPRSDAQWTQLARTDEVGQLARTIHTLSVQAYSERRQATQIRRTLDRRVAEATRRATHRLHRMAMDDPMTRLGNRRLLDRHLPLIVDACVSYDHDLVCIAIDLDNFKNVNDTLGHTTGDDLIRFLANLIRGNVRRDDMAVRMGGDEFAIFMPGCTLDRAQEIAARMTDLFNEHARTVLPEALSVGLSVGITSLRDQQIKSGDELIEATDQLLYEAKRTGKGRIITT